MEEIHYSCSISILKISLTIINFSEKIFSSFLSSLNSFLIIDKQIILHKDFCSIRQNVLRKRQIVRSRPVTFHESGVPFHFLCSQRKQGTRDSGKIIKSLMLFFTKGLEWRVISLNDCDRIQWFMISRISHEILRARKTRRSKRLLKTGSRKIEKEKRKKKGRKDGEKRKG